jgi:hypothetical protein
MKEEWVRLFLVIVPVVLVIEFVDLVIIVVFILRLLRTAESVKDREKAKRKEVTSSTMPDFTRSYCSLHSGCVSASLYLIP